MTPTQWTLTTLLALAAATERPPAPHASGGAAPVATPAASAQHAAMTTRLKQAQDELRINLSTQQMPSLLPAQRQNLQLRADALTNEIADLRRKLRAP
jgi:hypothetical protein